MASKVNAGRGKPGGRNASTNSRRKQNVGRGGADNGNDAHEDDRSSHDDRYETDEDARSAYGRRQFGDVRAGDVTGFGHPLSFQGKGFFGGNQPPFEHGTAHIGPGNAVGYGQGYPAEAEGFRGKGPKGYRRTDERMTEEINDRLTYDDHVDAQEISVSVAGGEATLNGTVNTRSEKRHAEDIADSVFGITHVQNNLRVKKTEQEE